jgi:hypothetical protein
MKPRFAVYMKVRDEWLCVACTKQRTAAFKAYAGLGDKEKKMERLEVTYLWSPRLIRAVENEL